MNVQLVFECVDLCSEGKFSFLLLSFLVSFLSHEIVDLIVLFSNQPVELLYLSNEGLDLLDMT